MFTLSLPLIETDSIRIRKTETPDLNFVISLEELDENSQFIIPWERERHQSALADSDILHLIIEEKSTMKPAGYIILAGIQNPNCSVELLRITISEKGKGLGRKAIQLVKQFVFED